METALVVIGVAQAALLGLCAAFLRGIWKQGPPVVNMAAPVVNVPPAPPIRMPEPPARQAVDFGPIIAAIESLKDAPNMGRHGWQPPVAGPRAQILKGDLPWCFAELGSHDFFEALDSQFLTLVLPDGERITNRQEWDAVKEKYVTQ